MPGKGTRPDQLVARRAVGVDREGEGRPGDRRPELHERLVADRAWRREAHPPADGLDEANRGRPDDGLRADVGQMDGREPERRAADSDRRGTDMPLAAMTVADDL